MKLVLSFVLGSTLLAGCGAERASKAAPTAGNDQCKWEGTVCAVSKDCCSMWCVNGYCERREP